MQRLRPLSEKTTVPDTFALTPLRFPDTFAVRVRVAGLL